MKRNVSSGFLTFRVTEDGMAGDRIRAGDLVMIEELSEVTGREIALILIERGDHLLRRIERRDDSYILVPSNQLLQRIIVKINDIVILGKVVEVRFAV